MESGVSAWMAGALISRQIQTQELRQTFWKTLSEAARMSDHFPDLAADQSFGEHRKHIALQAQLWSF